MPHPEIIAVTKKKANKQEPVIKETDSTDTNPYINLSIINKAFDISANEDDEAYVSTIGANLRKIDPSFDSRTYGFRNLTKLFESIDRYRVVKNIVNGLNHPLVKLK